jgi:hypothetical protein
VRLKVGRCRKPKAKEVRFQAKVGLPVGIGSLTKRHFHDSGSTGKMFEIDHAFRRLEAMDVYTRSIRPKGARFPRGGQENQLSYQVYYLRRVMG